ncbi:ester cyclase [Actinomadura alba]|uniref:Ester cyclase n=1 Tax=Actinomadura alba TaxID=406431 RepID=A0ABR7LPH0_9ACTN|nr:ester cyclase [Actinomadura alba]
MHRFYLDAWNRWDDSVVEEILAPDFVFRGSLGDEVRGPDGWRSYRDKIRSAVPDLKSSTSLPTEIGRQPACSTPATTKARSSASSAPANPSATAGPRSSPPPPAD